MSGNKIEVKERERGGGEEGIPCKRSSEVCGGLRLECETHEGN